MSFVIDGSSGITFPDATAQTTAAKINSGTVQNTTSGTSIDFTGIPTGTKQITVMLNGVSTNGGAAVILQLGDSGGVETTGYNGSTQWTSTYAAWSSYTGVPLDTASTPSAGWIRTGAVTFSLLNSSTNLWAVTGTVCMEGANGVTICSGTKATSATLDRVRLTTSNGTDTFDAGSINILYE